MGQYSYASEEDTPGYIIFNRAYVCTIPAAYARSVEELEYFGSVLTGDPSYDEELAHAPTKTTRTIEQLAVIFDNGVIPGIGDWEKNYPEIRDIINEHLNNCAETFNERSIYRHTPADVDLEQRAEDLAVLERFAKHLSSSCSYIGNESFSPETWLNKRRRDFIPLPGTEPDPAAPQTTVVSVEPREEAVVRISKTGRRVRTWQ